MDVLNLLRRPLPPIKTAHYTTLSPTKTAHYTTLPSPRSAGRVGVNHPQTLREDDDGVAPIISGFSQHPQRAAPVPRPPRPPDLFCLSDFLQVSGSGRGSADGWRRMVLSRCNYRKLLRLFLLELHCGWQDAVANQTLSCEGLSPPTRRIPRRQIICELAAMVQMEARAQNSFRSKSGVCRSSEDQSVNQQWTRLERRTEHTQHEAYTVSGCSAAHEVLLNAVTSKHFQNSRRSRSPFRCAGEHDIISASELAVLDCVTRGGTRLSFKAHFICDLPDVSSLSEHLQYLNLSFNDLTQVPQEVCDLHQLQVLKMRNNPIEELPAQISKLHKLQTLVVSFCKITQLPEQLYSLPCLQYLDMSYNLLSSLSSDIRHLRSSSGVHSVLTNSNVIPHHHSLKGQTKGLFTPKPMTTMLNIISILFKAGRILNSLSLYSLSAGKNYSESDSSHNDIFQWYILCGVCVFRSLRSLNIEGNQLVALPPGLLHVSMSELRMSGNYTHVLLWSENSCNSPQTLLHTAAHTLAHTHAQQRYTHLPPAARVILNSAGVCDACSGPMFGAGLKLIRPVPSVFGLPSVPVLFCCCSPACLHRFRNHTQPDAV
ncbi:uncharacterized protein LOC128020182 [Carassius gibelio]|uniref:uncharacterized protein LOC128020182 n=1 Tax=Carassius gibelio TaxID=101364 RepID=UPI00227822ED|nr:uncharacterized protein LOC128020182 [Carassius gibelio]